jgi:hypothetical protein
MFCMYLACVLPSLCVALVCNIYMNGTTQAAAWRGWRPPPRLPLPPAYQPCRPPTTAPQCHLLPFRVS